MSSQRKFLPLFPLTIFTTYVIISYAYGFSIKMIPIESPHLQILPNHFTIDERQQFLVNITISRALKLRKELLPDSMASQVYSLSESRFVTQIGLGEGEAFNSPYLILDTGSDLTWVQCEGCNPCFDLPGGKNFEYTRSPSFHRLSLYDPLCLPAQSYNRDGSCGFDNRYGITGNYVNLKGLLGRENFYLGNPNTGNSDMYPGVLMGCLLEGATPNLFGPNNGIAGLFGMSAGPRSFLAQLNHQTEGRFLYCLTPFSGVPFAQSTLHFGDDAQISGDDTRQVQTISMHVGTGYHLYLNDISVNGQRLSIDQSICALDGAGTKGFFIDSGAPYTALPQRLYTLLGGAVADYFHNNYGWSINTQRLPRLCYGPTPNYFRRPYPTVIFHFRNTNGYGGDIDMVLKKRNMFEEVGNRQGFCMAVVPVSDSSSCLFGAYQQSNFKFLFDVQNSILSFVPQTCRENRG